MIEEIVLAGFDDSSGTSTYQIPPSTSTPISTGPSSSSVRIPASSPETSQPPSKKGKVSNKTSLLEEELINAIREDVDCDKAFCESLVDDLKRLDLATKTFLKYKIQQLVYLVSSGRMRDDS